MRSRWERRWGDGARDRSSGQVTDRRLILPTAEVHIRAFVGISQCPEKAPTRDKPPNFMSTVKALVSIFNTEKALAGAFCGHGEVSRRLVDSSSADAAWEVV